MKNIILFENFEKPIILSGYDEDRFSMLIHGYINNKNHLYQIERFLNLTYINGFFDGKYTPLMILFSNLRSDDYIDETYDIFKLMLKLGADPYLINDYGHDAYYYAVPTKKRFFLEMIPNFLEEREIRMNAKKYNL